MEATTDTTSCDSIHTLFEAHRGRVYNFCIRMVAHRQTAEDLTQEIFVKALERRQQDAPLTVPWLYAVARNRCIDFLRREKSWKGAWNRLVTLFAPQTREGYRVEESLVERHLGLRVLQRMTPRYRALLILKNFIGLTYEEMAEALGTTPQSVGPMLVRANAQAAGILEKEGGRDAL